MCVSAVSANVCCCVTGAHAECRQDAMGVRAVIASVCSCVTVTTGEKDTTGVSYVSASVC